MKTHWMMVGLMCCWGIASAQTETKLAASDAAAGHNLGWSVAVDGDTAVAGTRVGSALPGAAYVFTRGAGGTWNEQAILTASDAEAGDDVGISVAIDGDTVVVGAEDSSGALGPGAAYVFTRDGGGAWSEQAKLVASDGETGDLFGRSVSVHADTVLVGADNDDDGGDVAGAAYVFTRDDAGAWSEQAKLVASDAAADDHLGHTVSLFGDTAVIGAYCDDEWLGSAYVFTRDAGGAWTEQAKLTASDGVAGDFFGISVSVHAGTALVGAYQHDESSGAAYVFTWDGNDWVEQAKITASDGQALDNFGNAVVVQGGAAVIAAYGDDDLGAYTGSAYVFTRGSGGVWTEQTKLTPSDATALKAFGRSVAISGDTVVAGATGDDDGGDDAGAAYAFSGVPIGLVFADGFETGDTSAWSQTVW